jgi:hypothetical protein
MSLEQGGFGGSMPACRYRASPSGLYVWRKKAARAVISTDVRKLRTAAVRGASVRNRGAVPRYRIAAAVLVGAVTLVSGGVAARAALTPSQYRVQATVICSRMHDQIAGLPYGKVGTRKQMIQYLNAALPAERNYVAALRGLQPPEQLRAMHDGVVSDEAAQLALTIRFLATLTVTRDAGFRAAIERWGAAATTISSDEKALLLGLRLPKCV